RRCQATGRAAAVLALLRRIVQFHHNTFWAAHDLALELMRRGALDDAEPHARNALRMAPENPQAHALMGRLMSQAHPPAAGESHYRKALALAKARDPILLGDLAWNLRNQGRMAEARKLYEEAVALAPHLLGNVLGWTRTEEADRNFERAAK